LTSKEILKKAFLGTISTADDFSYGENKRQDSEMWQLRTTFIHLLYRPHKLKRLLKEDKNYPHDLIYHCQNFLITVFQEKLSVFRNFSNRVIFDRIIGILGYITTFTVEITVMITGSENLFTDLVRLQERATKISNIFSQWVRTLENESYDFTDAIYRQSLFIDSKIGKKEPFTNFIYARDYPGIENKT